MQIDITELRTIANKLFDHLAETDRQQIDIRRDYYWTVPKSSAYDPYCQPTELNFGQLVDDLNELRRIQDGSAEPLAYAFTWLAAVLRVIGEEYVD
jgi:hypothetical protein